MEKLKFHYQLISSKITKIILIKKKSLSIQPTLTRDKFVLCGHCVNQNYNPTVTFRELLVQVDTQVADVVANQPSMMATILNKHYYLTQST